MPTDFQAVSLPLDLQPSLNRHERRAAVMGVNNPSPARHAKTLARLAREAQPPPAAIALLSRADVARALNVSPITVYRMTKSGLLHSLKLGGDPRSPVRYKAADIALFVEERLSNGATE